MDEKTEAMKAVECYLFHWEKQFTLKLDSESKLRMAKPQQPSVPKKQKPFKSHRMSGMISQLPELDTSPAINEFPVIPASPVEATPVMFRFPNDSENPTKMGDNLIVIDEVNGETVSDVVGVLITGMRLILIEHGGNIDLVLFFNCS